MRKFGFKIFDNDININPLFLQECVDFAKNKTDVFIELMVTTNCSKENYESLKTILADTEVRIHAAHSSMGFDAGNKDLEKQNRQIIAMAQTAADMFNSQTIVVHAGCGRGEKYINETIRQFKIFNDARIVVENLPAGADNTFFCGNTAAEIKHIMQESGCGFCFDFSHAICAALQMNLDIDKQLSDFFELKPNVYHLCDGNINIAEDMHLHFGEGNYPLQQFLHKYTADNAYITMETGATLAKHNDLWIDDYNYIKAL